MAVLRRYLVSCGGREEQAGYSPLTAPYAARLHLLGYTPPATRELRALHLLAATLRIQLLATALACY